MPAPQFVIDRRMVLKGGAAALGTLTLASASQAQSGVEAILFTISDLHAPYARLPALLETVRTVKAEASVPTAMLLNGDVFERGNVVCERSGGAADWAFLAALASEMPVVLNLGNHETAILDDMATFAARADQAGIAVISNLVDRRTGRFFAPVSDRLGLGGIDISLLGLAATNPFVYRPPVRETLTFLDTAQFVADAFADTSAGADLNVIMSHAGVSPDKTYLDSLPSGTVVQGAHDHLALDLVYKGIPYFHGGSWGVQLGALSLTKGSDGVQTSYQTHSISPRDGDTELAALIAAQMDEHLTDEDKEVIAEIPKAMDMHNSILLATEALRLATDADLAMIGHTTFGAPLAAGPLTRYDFDAFVRFGGGLKMVELSGEDLAGILARSNQFTASGLDGRTGDYVHVAEIDLDPSRRYRLAVNGWTALNQEAYLGTTDLPFVDVAGLELKAVIADHLATTF
ncbi:MAG: 5'-nucleotidase C-terminal domain-containing protein [Pseudomonadota bacterium]